MLYHVAWLLVGTISGCELGPLHFYQPVEYDAKWLNWLLQGRVLRATHFTQSRLSSAVSLGKGVNGCLWGIHKCGDSANVFITVVAALQQVTLLVECVDSACK